LTLFRKFFLDFHPVSTRVPTVILIRQLAKKNPVATLHRTLYNTSHEHEILRSATATLRMTAKRPTRSFVPQDDGETKHGILRPSG